MPCYDAGASSSGDSYYEKRTHKLARELCKLRAFILTVLEKENPQIVERFSEDRMNFFLEMKNEQIKHRNADKAREIDRIQRKIQGKKRDAERIVELGGVVTDKVTKSIKKYEKRLVAVKASDPMNTDLY